MEKHSRQMVWTLNPSMPILIEIAFTDLYFDVK